MVSREEQLAEMPKAEEIVTVVTLLSGGDCLESNLPSMPGVLLDTAGNGAIEH